MKYILLNIRCFLRIHNWIDTGWLRKGDILECNWCGKVKFRREK